MPSTVTMTCRTSTSAWPVDLIGACGASGRSHVPPTRLAPLLQESAHAVGVDLRRGGIGACRGRGFAPRRDCAHAVGVGLYRGGIVRMPWAWVCAAVGLCACRGRGFAPRWDCAHAVGLGLRRGGMVRMPWAWVCAAVGLCACRGRGFVPRWDCTHAVGVGLRRGGIVRMPWAWVCAAVGSAHAVGVGLRRRCSSGASRVRVRRGRSGWTQASRRWVICAKLGRARTWGWTHWRCSAHRSSSTSLQRVSNSSNSKPKARTSMRSSACDTSPLSPG